MWRVMGAEGKFYLIVAKTISPRTPIMSSSVIAKVTVACVSLMLLASCANTIRGMGKDTANTVNATQAAGHTVKKAAN